MAEQISTTRTRRLNDIFTSLREQRIAKILLLELLLEEPQLQGPLINRVAKYPDIQDMWDRGLVEAVLQRLEIEGFIAPDYDRGVRDNLSALRVPEEARDSYLGNP